MEEASTFLAKNRYAVVTGANKGIGLGICKQLASKGNVSNEWAKAVFNDVENLTEEKVDEVLSQYVEDFKEGSLETKGWPANMSAYTLSKVAMNVYTRILAKKDPDFGINCVCPGFVKTDVNYNTGILSVEEGAEGPVRLACCQMVVLLASSLTDWKNKNFDELMYAVVTGANKGIGLGICKQLAEKGVTVVLTARDEKRGIEAVEKLRESGLSDFILFHQLDAADPASIASLADFIKSQFGKLDILEYLSSSLSTLSVNNPGIRGAIADDDAIKASDFGKSGTQVNWTQMLTQTHELAEEGLNTNYYGAKRMCEALIPLLQLSDSPRIVNVSSSAGKLEYVSNEWAKAVLGDVENLTEERVDEPAICIKCVCPGYVKTDINYYTGILSVEECAEGPVRLALLPHGGPSGLLFEQLEEEEF
ncbi:hypothetical protein SLEP1_g24161 [Rubroshorea leprosula]|uniref:(+)-neomenthol dehydrogenase n=1 Tax=Rubroshorea leprosula TaxID=152421 RepID=A0AAV5JNY0_9ROSI|nr:hypothetical protein SLEP1_g24161 [Rubroshorea leprosula]